MTVMLYLILIVLITLNIVLRIFDELLFFTYRNTEIKNPVFIISSPRSGTTYLHRLLCFDEDQFSFMKLYQTLIISISFMKLVQFLGLIDRKIGSPLLKIVRIIGKFVFKGWEGIHPMGFDRAEEDEGIWFFNFTSPAWCLFMPFYKFIDHLSILDHFSESVQTKLFSFYKNCLKRIHFVNGRDKTFLIKSVISSGRILSILKFFPDARIIYIERDPTKTVPSYISMFSVPWKLHSPELKDNLQIFRDLGNAPIAFYKHFQQIRETVSEDKLIHLDYYQFIADPQHTVEQIYSWLGLELTDELTSALERNIQKSKSYRSKHKYSLEQYGYSEKEFLKIIGEQI